MPDTNASGGGRVSTTTVSYATAEPEFTTTSANVKGVRVSARARFRLRVSHPRFARFLRDINDDGRPDLLLPGGESSELWINEGGEDRPRFRRSAVVKTDLQRFSRTEGAALSDQLESAFRIPYLSFEDVNGDRRPDLVVVDDDRRAFHIQKGDGSVPQ